MPSRRKDCDLPCPSRLRLPFTPPLQDSVENEVHSVQPWQEVAPCPARAAMGEEGEHAVFGHLRDERVVVGWVVGEQGDVDALAFVAVSGMGDVVGEGFWSCASGPLHRYGKVCLRDEIGDGMDALDVTPPGTARPPPGPRRGAREPLASRPRPWRVRAPPPRGGHEHLRRCPGGSRAKVPLSSSRMLATPMRSIRDRRTKSRRWSRLRRMSIANRARASALGPA